MLQRLLTYQPSERILIEDALIHPWLSKSDLISDRELKSSMKKRHRDTLAKKRAEADPNATPDVATPFYSEFGNLVFCLLFMRLIQNEGHRTRFLPPAPLRSPRLLRSHPPLRVKFPTPDNRKVFMSNDSDEI